jgi:hypothetical protein
MLVWRPGPESIAIPCQVSPPTRYKETGGMKYAGRVLCLAFEGFLFTAILPLPIQNPGGPDL